MAHALNWFDIPVVDFARAKAFYEAILDAELQVADTPTGQVGMFPADWQHGEVGGAIMSGEGMVPSVEGTAVYLNANPDLKAVLDRAEGAGGKVLVPKTAVQMEDAGYIAFFLDTEGNRVGLHSVG